MTCNNQGEWSLNESFVVWQQIKMDSLRASMWKVFRFEHASSHISLRCLWAGHRRGTVIMSWSKRLNICLGVAHGLHYLHALAQPRIIHRDIKASNVLLDGDLNPKIADFGLALLFPDEESNIMMSTVAGTRWVPLNFYWIWDWLRPTLHFWSYRFYDCAHWLDEATIL